MLMHTDTSTLIPVFDDLSEAVGFSREDRATAEFALAVEAYKRRSGRQFPTWSEFLEVLRDLGYTKRTSVEGARRPPKVRINADATRLDQIKALLSTRGGVPSGSKAGPIYDFATEADRGRALDAARSRYGWTCVDPA